MKNVLVDASSVILLHKADLLAQMQASFHIRIAAAVYDELTRHQRPGATAIARERRHRRITVVTPKVNAGSRPLPAGLHRGERDTLLCFLDGGADFVIIDDGPGAGFCRRQAIPFVNALLCPRLLAAVGRLAHTEARSAMDCISRLGHYSAAIKRYAATCSDAALTAFLP
ncbi:MAG: hypothetical protein QNJ22_05610 [Desulfosarcinaceae bacterium]|nr:hypothetical protein [Desulfosarcinaceae bacterium]